MKRLALIVSLFSVLLVASYAFATADEATISKNVDLIVAEIEGGQDIQEIKADTFEPYAFIMEEDGNMIVHPSLAGESLAEKAPPVYQALMGATPEGIWVEYEWEGKTKHTYAKKTKDNMIVGSGY